jgi:hypothetical protein
MFGSELPDLIELLKKLEKGGRRGNWLGSSRFRAASAARRTGLRAPAGAGHRGEVASRAKARQRSSYGATSGRGLTSGQPDSIEHRFSAEAIIKTTVSMVGQRATNRRQFGFAHRASSPRQPYRSARCDCKVAAACVSR